MNNKQSQQLLEKNPGLEMFIEQGRFLTGYTSGGKAGESISIFLCRSPWICNCIQATASEYIAPGEVIVISDDSSWSISGSWKAYSPNCDCLPQSLGRGNPYSRAASDRGSSASPAVERQGTLDKK